MKKVAVIVTEYRHNSHADMILGRLLGEHGYEPRVKVASVYTDQVPDNDKSRDMAAKYGFPICGTIDDAVAFGCPDAKVDGIVVIGEHGNYPWNEKEQHLYPRRRFMEHVFKAMDRCGIRVPLFLDKHFSYDNQDAYWIYEQARKRGLPFMAGSSIPYTEARPAYDPAFLLNSKAIFVVSFGGIESYGFHAMEVMESLAERRQGGETGVVAVNALRGEEVWRSMDRGEWPESLLLEALSVQETTSPRHPRECCDKAVLFVVEYEDGTMGYVAQLPNYAQKWSYAVQDHAGSVIAASCYAGAEPPYRHFTTFTGLLEEMVITGKPPCRIERTLLTTGLINTAMEALFQNRKLSPPNWK